MGETLLCRRGWEEGLRANEEPYGRDENRAQLRKPGDHPCAGRCFAVEHTSIGVCGREHHADVFVADTSAIQRTNDLRQSDVTGIHGVGGSLVDAHTDSPTYVAGEGQTFSSTKWGSSALKLCDLAR